MVKKSEKAKSVTKPEKKEIGAKTIQKEDEIEQLVRKLFNWNKLFTSWIKVVSVV